MRDVSILWVGVLVIVYSGRVMTLLTERIGVCTCGDGVITSMGVVCRVGLVSEIIFVPELFGSVVAIVSMVVGAVVTVVSMVVGAVALRVSAMEIVVAVDSAMEILAAVEMISMEVGLISEIVFVPELFESVGGTDRGIRKGRFPRFRALSMTHHRNMVNTIKQ